MDNKILISDFVKLTRSTLKTVLYYHKIGLLKESNRSASGYRLYGTYELAKMRNINNLKQIIEILEPEEFKNYKESCPEMINHHQKVFGILDDFQWKKDYTDNLRKISEYFKEHLEQHKILIRKYLNYKTEK